MCPYVATTNIICEGVQEKGPIGQKLEFKIFWFVIMLILVYMYYKIKMSYIGPFSHAPHILEL